MNPCGNCVSDFHAAANVWNSSCERASMWIKLHDCEFMDVCNFTIVVKCVLIIFLFQLTCLANRCLQAVQALQDWSGFDNRMRTP